MALTEPQQLTPKDGDAIVFLVHNDAIRKAIEGGKVFYSLVDFVGYFAESNQTPRQYWNDVKAAMVKRYGFQASENIRQFKLLAQDGKKRKTDCGDIITIRRVIMSIPSHRAEPLRMWLAGKSDALLAYREQNVLEGAEWAADTTHADMAELEPPEHTSAFEDMGYYNRKADRFAPPDTDADRWSRHER
jgi:hypothetical protein